MLADVGACLKQMAGPCRGESCEEFVRAHFHVAYQGPRRVVLAHGQTAPKRLGLLRSLNVPSAHVLRRLLPFPAPFPSARGLETLEVSNMDSPIPTRGPELLAVDIAFLITATIAYFLRCYVRTRMIKSFGRDDYLMGIAMVSFYVSNGVSTMTDRYRLVSLHTPVLRCLVSIMEQEGIAGILQWRTTLRRGTAGGFAICSIAAQ